MKLVTLSELPYEAVSHNPRIVKQVISAYGELGCVTQFAQAVFPPGEVAPAHRHEDITEVFLVQSGEGVILVEQNEHPLRAGCCVIVEPNESHELKNTGDRDLVVTYFGVKAG
jgi:mannose-6-phosphate isomerase-like protein (cupin superfamily)